MVVDTSALGAILFSEDDRHLFLDTMLGAERAMISAATLVEATSICTRDTAGGLEVKLEATLKQARLEIIPFDAAQAEIAREAYRRYGKGRHPARLNLGDTFAYALAIHLNEPLLFKGDDFARTDVTPAV